MTYPYCLVPGTDKIRVDASSPMRKNIPHSDYGHITQYGPAAHRYNRAVRDEFVMMVTGDEPYTALSLTNPDHHENPFFHVLGSLEILGIGGVNATEFDGNSTTWSFSSGVKLRTVLTPSGFAGMLSTSKTAYVRAQFGQMRLICDHFRSAYFEEKEGLLPTDVVMQGTNSALLSCGNPQGEVTETCLFTAFDAMGSYACAPVAAFDYVLTEGKEYYFSAVCLQKGTAPQSAEDIKAAISASDEKFASRLAACRIQTPDFLLDGGFVHAVLNHYYDHVGQAWYEGCHWWNNYFTNNYQISCAIALGNYDLARQALLFFASLPDGYDPIHADGSQGVPLRQSGETCRPMHYDGAPYYIYELYEYIETTGDTSVFQKVKAWLFDMLTAFEQVQYDGGAWGFHFGCNPFLYQADMLALPHASSSVGIFMAGMYRRLAKLCRLCGEAARAADFEEKAALTDKHCLSELWDDTLGCFYSHRDFEGKAHHSHYYTDFVFPSLYGTFPAEITDACLAQCRQRLMFTASSGKTLMRVGTLKPSGFGQDNVMPVQMSEAAAAYLENCDPQTGVQLLDGVALGATVFTEAPGNFPERMGPDGKGEGDYIFGNPCAVYAYRTVRSLFGLYVEDLGQTLCVSPCLPYDWENAALKLPIGELNYRRSGDTLCYSVKTDRSYRRLRFRLGLPLCEKAEFFANGVPLSPALRIFRSGQRAEFELPACGEIAVTVKLQGIKSADPLTPPAPAEISLPHVLSAAETDFKGSTALNLGVLPDTQTCVRSGWRNADDYEIPLKTDAGAFRTPWGVFRVQTLEGDKIRFRRVAKGSGRGEARIPEYFSPDRAVYSVAVEQKCSAVLPLFVSEAESRLTDSTVGSITLEYGDGSREVTPLIHGRTFTPLICVYGDCLWTSPLANAGGSCEDSICVLPLRANPKLTLKRIRFEIDTVDAFLNVAGVNIVPAP